MSQYRYYVKSVLQNMLEDNRQILSRIQNTEYDVLPILSQIRTTEYDAIRELSRIQNTEYASILNTDIESNSCSIIIRTDRLYLHVLSQLLVPRCNMYLPLRWIQTGSTSYGGKNINFKFGTEQRFLGS